MSQHPHRNPARRRPRTRRVPSFIPVPLRARADGWTPWRQAAFLVALARTRSVRAAAQAVGMSRMTAYRLRGRPNGESFASAWDRVLGRGGRDSRKVTPWELTMRAQDRLLRPVVHAGRLVALEEKPDNTALLRYVARFDRLLGLRAEGGRAAAWSARGFASTSGLELTSPRPRPSAGRPAGQPKGGGASG